ncbi:hypothetical protein FA13DRAFT_1621066 [Coprinellus micaceus]|uniref:Uncharacterized protein n=1 Tax=Coprinellus micaceus TaxID=71717 RepID=A0A4Y7TVX1_COPMI|nr:hypothetical protein FA13DRAFT_1621066 [Coprinellus micaceus]
MAPLVGSVPVPPEPEVPPYRPLKTLHAYPPIWAETRQEVCESFEWFRSYQGGVYFSHDTVRGYLLSAFGAKRDIFAHEGRLIISHGGGKAESIHKERGQCVLRGAEDQRSDDKSVRALLKTYRDRRPIALVIDDRYAKFPYDLGSKGVTYAVLGFYMIVQAWAEVQPDPSSGRNIVKFKFAFQWCEGQGDPWWLSESGKADIVDFDEDARSYKVREEECPQCWEESPQVYSQGWACLQPTCPRFWQLGQTDSTPTDPLVFLPEELTYHEGFLALREPCPLPIGFETLRPPPVKERADGISTSHYFTRGFHCDKCGRLSCRVEWQKWKCNTPGCDKSYTVKAKVRDAKEFWSQPITTRYLTAELAPSAKIKRLPSRSFFDEAGNLAGMIDTFVLPEQQGFLHHIQPPGPHSRLEANDIFRKYQEQANDGSLAFKRWPMRAHKCRGALLTNYFSHNEFEPLALTRPSLQYVGGTDNTVPFNKAPSAVVDARALIQRRISQALGRRAGFNEVLTAAYMEKQKMAGDVFVMDGIGVQKFYEHTVVPTNFRIAATARSINAPAPLTQAINRSKPIGHSHVPSAPIVSVKVKVEPPPAIALTPLELVCGPMLTMPELASQSDS